MSTDELTMILNAINGMAGDASRAAIWWMALHYGTKIVVALTIAATIITLGTAAIRAATFTNAWALAGRRVAKAWGGEGGIFSFMMSGDERAIERAINAAAAQREVVKSPPQRM